MNLLVLSSWFPYPPGNGSRVRAFYLLSELVRAGHTIRLVAGLQDDVASEKDSGISTLREMGIDEVVVVPWKWYEAGKSGKWGRLRTLFSAKPRSILETPNPPLVEAIAEQFARPTDAVLVMETGMDNYLPHRLPPEMPFVLDGVEFAETLRLASESLSGKAGKLNVSLLPPDTVRWRSEKIAAARKAKQYWSKRFRRYAFVTTVSHKEAEAVNLLLPAVKNAVVPNGVDVSAYEARNWSAVKWNQLIYNGSPDYGPNYEAVLWFGQNVMPRVREKVPEACLWVTGTYTRKKVDVVAFGPKVYLSGFITDIGVFFAEAAVCVVPLLQGGGTRLKILEAWAAGVPVVSTTVGAAGLDGAIPGIHFLQADTPDEFAEATIRLMTDAALCRTLSENARALVAERYTWSGSGKALNELLLETCRVNKPS